MVLMGGKEGRVRGVFVELLMTVYDHFEGVYENIDCRIETMNEQSGVILISLALNLCNLS